MRPQGLMRIGAWELHIGAQQLRRGAEVRRLNLKEMSLLLKLVEVAPDLAPTEMLLDHCWPGRVVTDGVIYQTVRGLRRALADDARQPLYIETLPKRGYRLVAPIERPRIASSVRSPDEDVARSLIRRAREWRGSHPEENAIGIELLEQAAGLDATCAEAYAWLAWRLAWQSRHSGERRTFDLAVEAAGRAIELAPDLSWSHYALGQLEAVAGRLGAAVRHYRNAVSLEPVGDFVLLDLCHLLTRNGQLEEALAAGVQACRLNPDSANCWYHVSVPLQLLGDTVISRTWLSTAIQRFPEDPACLRCILGRMQLDLLDGDIESARTCAREIVGAVAPHITDAVLPSAEVLIFAKDFDAASRSIEIAMRSGLENTSSVMMTVRSVGLMNAFCQINVGDRTAGTRYLEERAAMERDREESLSDVMLEKIVELAAVYALLGDDLRALDLLEMACTRGYCHYRLLQRDPMLAVVSRDPRFVAILQKMRESVSRMTANIESQGLLAACRQLCA